MMATTINISTRVNPLRFGLRNFIDGLSLSGVNRQKADNISANLFTYCFAAPANDWKACRMPSPALFADKKSPRRTPRACGNWVLGLLQRVSGAVSAQTARGGIGDR